MSDRRTASCPLLLDRIPPLRWLRRLLPSGRGLVILVPYLWLLRLLRGRPSSSWPRSASRTRRRPCRPIRRSSDPSPAASSPLPTASRRRCAPATETAPATSSSHERRRRRRGAVRHRRRPAGGCGGRALHQAELGQLRLSLHRQSLLQGGQERGLHGLHLDHALPADRLSHGLWHRALAVDLAQHAADADHPALLDLVPDPGLCLDRHPEEQRADQQFPDLARGDQRSDPDDEHRISRSSSASSIPICRS